MIFLLKNNLVGNALVVLGHEHQGTGQGPSTDCNKEKSDWKEPLDHCGTWLCLHVLYNCSNCS